MPRYIARFTAQAWIRDYAVDVDPEGETEWEPVRVPAYIQTALDGDPDAGWILDRHDELIRDANAPAWIRDWRGPFSICVCVTDDDADPPRSDTRRA